MSIALGPLTASYVNKGTDGLNAFREPELRAMQAEIAASGDSFSELDQALSEIIEDTELSTRNVGLQAKRQRAAGRFLIAASDTYGPATARLPIGLLYAEGYPDEVPQAQTLGFSALRVGTWVSRTRAEAIDLTPVQVTESLWNSSINQVEESGKMIWGIPVNRQTRLTDIRTGETGTYGHMTDIEAISNLPETVPPDLLRQLTEVVDRFHSLPHLPASSLGHPAS